jgi:hypothetical protein
VSCDPPLARGAAQDRSEHKKAVDPALAHGETSARNYIMSP